MQKVFQDIDFDDANCETDFDQEHFEIEKQTDCVNVSQDIFEIKENIGTKDAIMGKPEFKDEVEDLHINDQDFLQEFEDAEIPFEKTNVNAANSPMAIFHDIVLPVESKIHNNLGIEDENTIHKAEISRQPLVKPKKSTMNVEKREVVDFDFLKPSTSKFLGFKTAANKEIKISLQALEKVKDFYKEIDTDFNTNVNSDNLKQTKDIDPNTEEVGSNMEKTLTNTEDLFAEELVLNEDFFKDSIIESEDTEYPIFKGFQTANHKAIKISEKALQMSKKLFEDITSIKQGTDVDSNSKVQKDEVNNKENVKSSIPFSTAKDLGELLMNKKILKTRSIDADNVQKKHQCSEVSKLAVTKSFDIR